MALLERQWWQLSRFTSARDGPLTHPPTRPPTHVQDTIVAAGYVLHIGRQPAAEIKVGDAVTAK